MKFVCSRFIIVTTQREHCATHHRISYSLSFANATNILHLVLQISSASHYELYACCRATTNRIILMSPAEIMLTCTR